MRRTLEAILDVVPPAEFRLVGTASCVLRGIDVEANDVDILFARREPIDAWTNALAGLATVRDAPAWRGDAQQYFARLELDGVVVELSTVEVVVDTDTAECVGTGPWTHWDDVPCGPHHVATVALELRLVTEVARQRQERWEPIVAFLRPRPCDLELVERGLVACSTTPEAIASITRSLGRV